MKDIYLQSQWDTLLVYLQQGRPALWILLAILNGGFALFWLFVKITKDRPLRPATISLARGLFVFLNMALAFRDDTVRIIRPLLTYFI